MLDIKDFYWSMKEELLNKELRFAQEYIDITSKENHYFLLKRTQG